MSYAHLFIKQCDDLDFRTQITPPLIERIHFELIIIRNIGFSVASSTLIQKLPSYF